MRPVVLVTGGAGYIGSHVCKALAAQGMLPVTFDNLSHGHYEAVRWGPLEKGDLGDAARLDGVFARHRPVAVMHFAGLIAAGESVKDPAAFHRNNVGGTQALLESMLRNDVARIVFSSTAAVYGEPRRLPMDEGHPLEPINPYGAGKLACERMMADLGTTRGLRSVSLRYFNAAGADPDGEIGEAHDPETHLIPLALDAALGRRPDVMIYGASYDTRDGTCVRDYVHVADLAAAHLLALRRLDAVCGAEAFNLGNGRGFTVREVIDAVARVTERPVRTRIADPRAGDPPVLLADAARAAAELGWVPAHSDLETQLRHAWQWHRRRFAAEA